MKLQQLRYLLAIVDNELNITAAAERLYTSQPGVSKQLKLLEEELGIQVFTRHGKSLGDITPAGSEVISRARVIMREVENIRHLAADSREQQTGRLAIGTTHTQARYVLPPVIKQFRERYPGVTLDLHQGTSEQIQQLAKTREIDFAISSATSAPIMFSDMTALPCYRWDRVVIAPNDHELAALEGPLTLQELARFPLITYVFSFAGESSLKKAFAQQQLEPEVVFTARDADVIKTYVRIGMGVGIVASMAQDCGEHGDLVALEATNLFPRCTTWLGFPTDTVLRRYMFDFIELFAPHLSPELTARAAEMRHQAAVEQLFAHVELPIKGRCAETVATTA